MPRISSPNATLSITRRWASSPKCWKTIETEWRRSSRSSAALAAVTSWPRDPDRARGRLDQADQRADERRLARAREAHDDEHLARPDVERDVADGRDAAGLLAELRARQLRVGRPDDAVRLRAEDLPDARSRDERLTGTAVAGHAADISVVRRPAASRPAAASGTRVRRRRRTRCPGRAAARS